MSESDKEYYSTVKFIFFMYLVVMPIALISIVAYCEWNYEPEEAIVCNCGKVEA